MNRFSVSLLSFAVLVVAAILSMKSIVVPSNTLEINRFLSSKVSPAIERATEGFWFADDSGNASNGLALKSIRDINNFLTSQYADRRNLNFDEIYIQSIGSIKTGDSRKSSYYFTSEIFHPQNTVVVTYGVILQNDNRLLIYAIPISAVASLLLTLALFPLTSRRSKPHEDEVLEPDSQRLEHEVDPIRGALIKAITINSGLSLHTAFERCASLNEEELNVARQWSADEPSSFGKALSGPRWNNLSLSWIKVLIGKEGYSYEDSLPIAAEFSPDQIEEYLRYRNDSLNSEIIFSLLRRVDHLEWTDSGIEWLQHLTKNLDVPVEEAVTSLNSSISLKIYIHEKRVCIFGYEFELPPQEFALYAMIADQTSHGVRLKAPSRIASDSFQSLFNKYYRSLANARHNVTEKIWDDEATSKAIHQTTLKLRVSLKVSADSNLLDDFLLRKVQIGSDYAIMLPLSLERIEVIKTKQRQLPSEQSDTITLAKSLSI